MNIRRASSRNHLCIVWSDVLSEFALHLRIEVMSRVCYRAWAVERLNRAGG